MELFNVTYKNDRIILKILGIKIKFNCNPFKRIEKDFKSNQKFDCKSFDCKIAKITDKLFRSTNFKKVKINNENNNNIAIIATMLYDWGGHTEYINKFIENLPSQYITKIYLTRLNETLKYAIKKFKKIEEKSTILGVNLGDNYSYKQDLLKLYSDIINYSPKVLFVFMHMDDCFTAALLYLLRKYTNIKIIYINHGSHFPALGISFAHFLSYTFDSILEVNKELRNFHNNIYLNLIDERKENIVDISEDKKCQIRKELGICENNYFTLSGASSYKFFINKKSPYFIMIKDLLEKEPKLQHIVITELSDEEQKIVDSIFQGSKVYDRLKFCKFTPSYSEIFQSCDLFIDSFPIASALTHLELMKHKKVSIIKKDDENILYNFYEYFPKDYRYIFSNVNDIKNNVLSLLHAPELRTKIGNELYEHYLRTFEGSVAIKRYVDVIENCESKMEKFNEFRIN